MFSEQLITELGEILKDDFGQKLSTQEIEKIAFVLVNYFELLTIAEFNKPYDGV